MTETIPGVNVQALRTFFSQYFDQPKTSTQPRCKTQKKRIFSKGICSKSDLTARTNSNLSSFSRSVSAFDLSNTKPWNVPSEKKHCVDETLKPALFISTRTVCGSANSCQGTTCTLDTASNDSGVEENFESSFSEDSRQAYKCSFHSVINSSTLNWNVPAVENDLCNDESETRRQNSPTVNITIKNPCLVDDKHIQPEFSVNQRNVMTTVWNRTYEVDISREIEKNSTNKPSDKLFYSEVVISDNYVCKAQYKRTKLPSLEVLGSPPCKPEKLDVAKLSQFSTSKCQPFRKKAILPRIGTTENINKLRSDSTFSKIPFTQDIIHRNYHQQTASDETSNNAKSYQQQTFACKSIDNLYNGRKEKVLLRKLPRLPPRRFSCPSQCSEKTTANFPDIHGEDLYQDTEANDEEVYEEVTFPRNCEPQLYAKHGNSDKMPKELSRLWQKEQRECTRRERQLQKVKKKFGITGNEIPLDKGYIKNDAKGGHGDLSVKKGESVLILRIEDNPIGRLLAKNERGKIGYVALDNLTVDADSVKTVMRERSHSMGSKEERYSSSSGEAIYEEC